MYETLCKFFVGVDASDVANNQFGDGLWRSSALDFFVLGMHDAFPGKVRLYLSGASVQVE